MYLINSVFGARVCTCRVEVTSPPDVLVQSDGDGGGSSVLVSAEQCDDGSGVSDDGCGASRTIAPGWASLDPRQPCQRAVCGNGLSSGPPRIATTGTTHPVMAARIAASRSVLAAVGVGAPAGARASEND